MLRRFHTFAVSLSVCVALHSATAKEVQLLHGQLSFNGPADIVQGQSSSRDSERYSILADFTSHDGGLSVRVTYGKHELEAPDMADFLRQKVSSYTTLDAKLPHFYWIEHQIVTRDGRRWAEIRFMHDNNSGAHVYTRCLSCFTQGHLLEVWALTRRGADPRQKAYVDRLIDSVRLAPEA